MPLQKDLQDSISEMSKGYIISPRELYRTGTQSLKAHTGGHCKRWLELTWWCQQWIIHRQMDRPTERIDLSFRSYGILSTRIDQIEHSPSRTFEFAINSAVSRSTNKVPFEIVYGYLPRSFPHIVFNPDNPAWIDFTGKSYALATVRARFDHCSKTRTISPRQQTSQGGSRNCGRRHRFHIKWESTHAYS